MDRCGIFNFRFIFTLATVLLNSMLYAQEAPVWLDHLIRDEITDPGYLESQKVLDPYTISTVRITMDPDDYNFLLTNIDNNEYLLANMTYESPTIPLTTIEQVGIRLRGAVARGVRKKSFKISFRAFGHDDREFHSLRKLNLNCDFQDIHLMRAKTCTDLFRLMGVDAARVGYSKLFINGEYRGLFANSEDIDKAFLETRFGDNNGNLYKCDGASLQNGSGGYRLTTNEDFPDYSDILEFINVLNNTPADRFKEEIEKVFDVDEMLMYLACNVLLGAWDDYWVLAKNYYIYHDLISDQFNYIPHDFDGSLGTYWYPKNMDVAYDNVYDWSPNSGRPMVENLLAVPEYRDRYTHYLMLLCMGPFSLEAMEPEIDRTADVIRGTLVNDPFWDWTPSDFDRAFDQAISQGNNKYGMKEYIQLRRNSALQQLDEVGPFIKETGRTPLLPDETNPVTISALVVDRYNVSSVTLTYKMNGYSDELTMLDDGQGVDDEALDFVYSVQIPSSPDAYEVQYFIEAANNNGKTSRFPARNEWMTYQVNYQPPIVLINELLARNDSTNHDNRNEYDDWFELYNPGDDEIDLTGMYVSDNLSQPRKWRLGNLSIQPGGFVLLWADDDPEQGTNHVGFKLSGSGEVLGLFDTDEKQNTQIDIVQFPAQLADVSFGRTEDGAEEWIFYDKPTPGFGNRDSIISYEDLSDITDLEGAVIIGSNEDNPWEGASSGAGSPPGEEIDMLIDNDILTKYLVRDIESWVEIVTNEPSMVRGYSITSANDVPTRDPRSWQLQGWDAETESWVTLHYVENNPSWEERFLSKDWYFENREWYSRYRLNITAINFNAQNLMQMAELQIWGLLGQATANESASALPDKFQLQQNYPNPFNPSTTIRYKLDNFSHIMLTVHNVKGQLINTLAQGHQPAGSYEIQWNGTNASGARSSSGLYFYTLHAKSQGKNVIRTHKMLLMK